MMLGNEYGTDVQPAAYLFAGHYCVLDDVIHSPSHFLVDIIANLKILDLPCMHDFRVGCHLSCKHMGSSVAILYGLDICNRSSSKLQRCLAAGQALGDRPTARMAVIWSNGGFYSVRYCCEVSLQSQKSLEIRCPHERTEHPMHCCVQLPCV